MDGGHTACFRCGTTAVISVNVSYVFEWTVLMFVTDGTMLAMAAWMDRSSLMFSRWTVVMYICRMDCVDVQPIGRVGVCLMEQLVFSDGPCCCPSVDSS